jgi:DtxR family Mn-dependent transcriptional regulator
MHGPEPVSTTQEMYLKVLLQLSETKPIGRVRDLAKELGVTPGSVSLRLSKLKELGYVEQERYGGVLLTPAGEAIARCVTRRFETLKTLLVEVFGIDPETAESDACKMEHAVSPTTVNRMEALIERLRQGESLSPETLSSWTRDIESRCADCEALGVCGAAQSAARPQDESAGS